MTTALFITFSILAFALVVFALVDCVTRRPAAWYFWLLFVLLGFVPISLDLTSGKVSIELLSVVILGAKLVKSGSRDGAGWIIGFSVPLGALIWLGRIKPWARSRRSGQGKFPDFRPGVF